MSKYYYYLKAKNITDPPAAWKKGNLYIYLQQAEIDAAELTPDELTACGSTANQEGKPLEKVISAAKYRKAAEEKYKYLEDNQLIPPRPAQVTTEESSSESNFDTESEKEDFDQAQDTSATMPGDPDAAAAAEATAKVAAEATAKAKTKQLKDDWSAKWALWSESQDQLIADIEAALLVPEAVGTLKALLHEMEESIQERQILLEEYWSLENSPPERLANHNELVARQNINSKCKRSLKAKIQELEPNPTPENRGEASSSSSSNIHVRLPKIELPKFDGQWRNWVGYRDAFENLVLNVDTSKIPRVTKFHYLKTSLGPEPLRVIQSIPVTGDNLDRAWTSIIGKYHNPRKLKQDYLRELDNIRPMTHNSGKQLRSIFDRVNDAREALKVLGEDMDSMDFMLVDKITRNFDKETRSFFEMIACDDNSGSGTTWDQVKKFVQKFSHIWDNSEDGSRAACKSNSKQEEPKTQKTTVLTTNSKGSCPFCPQSHFPQECEKFKKSKPEGRRDMVKSKQLCYNCLSSRHMSRDCKSSHRCRTCNKFHHTMLHIENYNVGRSNQQPYRPYNNNIHNGPQTRTNTSQGNMNRTVIIPTAMLLIEDNEGIAWSYRAMLDSGSQSSYITERAMNDLGLKRKWDNTMIYGIGDENPIKSRGYTELTIRSPLDPTFNMKIPVLILPRITGVSPPTTLQGYWKHLEDIPLADKGFRQPGEIDILLSADIMWRPLRTGLREGRPMEPVARETVFGWVIAGNSLEFPPHHIIRSHLAVDDSRAVLEKFWALESLPTDGKEWTADERKCEEIFKKSTIRAKDGKFVVKMPFREEEPKIARSRIIAAKRLQGVEMRLNRQPELRKEYEAFMEDYEQQHHMQPVHVTDGRELESYNYLPHHPVVRQQALTTKVRVVFDASCKTANGISLNDEQLVGPVIQDDLVSILLRFRLHKYAVNGDIAQMYRQIWITAEQQPLQSIIWRRKPGEPITTFHLTTVTYGTASAPWLATRCLKQIADDIENSDPKLAAVIRHDFYMDDCLSGADTTEQARKLQQDVVHALAKYGFPLRKLASNEDKIIEAVEPSSQAFTINPEPVVKTLGLQWTRAIDAFGFKVELEDNSKWTKRKILSEIAKIFDPMGYAAPIIITAKIIMQDIWKDGTAWDELPTSEVMKKYMEFRRTLPQLKDVSIPRWLNCYSDTLIEQHGFADASEKAYAAAVYLRVQREGKISSNLIAAKTRVSPIKVITLPRLELCGAVLLTQLVEHVKRALRRQNITVYAYTDSTITLAWIQGSPGKFKTFVAHRVSQIQSIIPPASWRHVKSEENPADLASRGIMPHELSVQTQWFHGPPWLQQELQLTEQEQVTVEHLLEVKQKTTVAHTTVTKEDWTDKFSKWKKLLRVTAITRRFIYNSKEKKKEDRATGRLTPFELQEAFHSLCRHIQVSMLPKEYATLEAISKMTTNDPDGKHKDVIRKSKLNNLQPFFDTKSKVIRVGGRLRHSHLESDVKHPIILPDCRLTRMYLEYLHDKHLHAGPTLLLSTARQQVWIMGGKNAARQVVRKCITCSRWRAVTPEQMMGDLPTSRTEAVRPFYITGIDYAGPVMLQHRRGRGVPTHKGYICVFVCFSTKAIHLEAVTDQSTECFIAALRRFIARRSRPHTIYCDNATTFVGADNELRELWSQEQHQLEVVGMAADEGITFKFIPPGAPHMGGLWESGVKSTKHHLRRVLGGATLSYEELTTLLCQIEACLNSRPLCPLTEDSSEQEALTPGHFLVGRALNKCADPNLTDIKESHLSRWQFLQKLQQQFWSRWHKEYLTTLQNRKKWNEARANLTEGMVVLIKEDNTPPTAWRLAVIIEVHPGPDDKVRVATLRTTTPQGKIIILKRPIVKLIPLVEPDEEVISRARENVQSSNEDEQDDK